MKNHHIVLQIRPKPPHPIIIILAESMDHENNSQKSNLNFIDFIQNLIQNEDPNEYRNPLFNQQLAIASAIQISDDEEEEIELTPPEFVQFRQISNQTDSLEEEEEIEPVVNQFVKKEGMDEDVAVVAVVPEIVEQSEVWPTVLEENGRIEPIIDLISDDSEEVSNESVDQGEEQDEEQDQEEQVEKDEQDVEKDSSQFSGNPFDEFAAEIQDEEDFILEQEMESEEIIGDEEEIQDQELSGSLLDYNGEYEEDSFINDDDSESEYSEKKRKLRKVSDIEKKKKLRKQRKVRKNIEVAAFLKKIKKSKK